MMNTDNLLRALSVVFLALVIGLISARVPSFSEPEASFSWPGMFVGVGLVAIAFLLSRLFVSRPVQAPAATPAQLFMLKAGLILFLIALVLFVAILYTTWAWPFFFLRVAVVCGVLTVFALVGSAWFGRQG